MPKVIISYLRYHADQTTENTELKKNISLVLYHINLNQFILNSTENILDQLLTLTQSDQVRQCIETDSIINQDISEWDWLNLKLTGLDQNSGIIILAKRKSKINQELKESIVDYYFINNALNELEQNPNLVYNSDGHYLYEINQHLDLINESRNNYGKEHPKYQELHKNFLDQELIKIIQKKLTKEVIATLDAHKFLAIYNQAVAEVKENKTLVGTIEILVYDYYHKSVLESFFEKYLKSVKITTQMYEDPNIGTELLNDIVHDLRCIKSSSFTKTKNIESCSKISIHYAIL